jgi:hypothetical protein
MAPLLDAGSWVEATAIKIIEARGALAPIASRPSHGRSNSVGSLPPRPSSNP